MSRVSFLRRRMKNPLLYCADYLSPNNRVYFRHPLIAKCVGEGSRRKDRDKRGRDERLLGEQAEQEAKKPSIIT